MEQPLTPPPQEQPQQESLQQQEEQLLTPPPQQEQVPEQQEKPTPSTSRDGDRREPQAQPQQPPQPQPKQPSTPSFLRTPPPDRGTPRRIQEHLDSLRGMFIRMQNRQREQDRDLQEALAELRRLTAAHSQYLYRHAAEVEKEISC